MTLAKVFPRSASRLIAVQILYSYNYNKDAISPLIIDHVLSSKVWQLDIQDIDEVDMKQLDKKFLLDILQGVQEHDDYITKVIEQFLVNITLADLNLLTVAILKCAIWEIVFNSKETERGIIVAQYVALASCFYVNNEVSLVNKLLATISQEMKAD